MSITASIAIIIMISTTTIIMTATIITIIKTNHLIKLTTPAHP